MAPKKNTKKGSAGGAGASSKTKKNNNNNSKAAPVVDDDDAFLDSLLEKIQKQKLEDEKNGKVSAPSSAGSLSSDQNSPAAALLNKISEDEDEGRDKSKDEEVIIPTDGTAAKQTVPPRVGLTKIYIDGRFPEGEISDYTYGEENLKRRTSEEKRALERLEDEQKKYEELRRGAEIHRTIRTWARKSIKPGMKMVQIANLIENSTRALSEGKNLRDAGIGFPTGLSVNHCAAHYTPNKGDQTVLKHDDVMKVDFGVHINGRIIDSAFTMSFNDKYETLLTAVRDATNTGIREAGIDVRLGEIGAAIQETMESYELELDGKTYPVKCIRNLNGHNILPYQIHGGKSVPIVKNNDMTKMEEGEVFAIETFGSTGRGYVHQEGECSHYGRNPDAGSSAGIKLNSAKSLLNAIDKNFGTLPFCRRYLDRLGQEKYVLGLNSLVRSGHVNDYPPLCDTPGSYTAQFEHTILLRPTVKEVLSRGDDF